VQWIFLMKEVFMDRSKPAWWQLFVLGACATGLIVLASLWNVSETLRGTANIAIVLTAYGAFNVWLSFNGEAIENQQKAKQEAASGKAFAVTARQAHYRHLTRLHAMLKSAPEPDKRD
jgi:hypothetical protein